MPFKVERLESCSAVSGGGGGTRIWALRMAAFRAAVVLAWAATISRPNLRTLALAPVDSAMWPALRSYWSVWAAALMKSGVGKAWAMADAPRQALTAVASRTVLSTADLLV